MAIPTLATKQITENFGHIRQMAIDFSSDEQDRAAIIRVLRDKLYSDKILAPIREYSTNAADAHVEAGKGHIPIEIKLPTRLRPTLQIRDYGAGLTVEEIEHTYTKYGKSTKRSTNTQTGQLGLGCKSAFAYGDNFVVVSFKNGKKTTYNLTSSGICTVLADETILTNDTGIEIIIPVKNEHIDIFCTKAINFFKYWAVKPTMIGKPLSTGNPQLPDTMSKLNIAGDNWEFDSTHLSGRYAVSDVGSVAVMGNIPYPINWDLVVNALGDSAERELKTFISEIVHYLPVIIKFEVGQLDFAASRESLEYTDQTIVCLKEIAQQIKTQLASVIQQQIADAPSYWEALRMYHQIFSTSEYIRAYEIRRRLQRVITNIQWGGITIRESFIKLNCTLISDGNRPNITPVNVCLLGIRNNAVFRSWIHINKYTIDPYTTNLVIVNDLDKPKCITTTIRWLVNTDQLKTNTPVHVLRFHDDVQKSEFIARTRFESVPYIYASSVQAKVDAWKKANRKSQIKLNLPVIKKQTRSLKYGVLNPNYQKITPDRSYTTTGEFDVNTIAGFYCNIRQVGVDKLTYYASLLLHNVETPYSTVYFVTGAMQQYKWFTKAVEQGRLINLYDFIKTNKDVIVKKYSNMLNLHLKNKLVIEQSLHTISPYLIIDLLPKINSKRGTMGKLINAVLACKSDLSTDIISAFLFFCIRYNTTDDSANKSSTVDFKQLYADVMEKYPLIGCIEPTGKSRYYSYKITWDDYVKYVAEYVNVIDRINYPHLKEGVCN